MSKINGTWDIVLTTLSNEVVNADIEFPLEDYDSSIKHFHKIIDRIKQDGGHFAAEAIDPISIRSGGEIVCNWKFIPITNIASIKLERREHF